MCKWKQIVTQRAHLLAKMIRIGEGLKLRIKNKKPNKDISSKKCRKVSAQKLSYTYTINTDINKTCPVSKSKKFYHIH